MIPPYLHQSLAPSFESGDSRFVRQHVADLIVTSGELVACDPLTCPEAPPFTVKLPRGRYPVDVTIAHIETDQRVAFAILTLTGGRPLTWDLLTIDGQDIAALGDDEFFGYGVDSGTGCFMDRDARDVLLQRMDEESDYYEVLVEEMENTYRHTWSWMATPLGAANLVAFSSGYGDGAYATYGGYDVDGNLAVIVTDFGIIEDDDA